MSRIRTHGSSLSVIAFPVVATLVLATLPVLFAAAPAQAAYARLYEPSLTPLAGARFTLTGIITSDVRRPVKLQRLSPGGGATTIAKGEATRNGTFTIPGVVLPPTSSTLRAVAPRCPCGLNNAKPRVATEPIEIRAVRQSGTLAAVPPIVQQGSTPAPPDEAGHLVASFLPARPGRPVRLDRLVKGRWEVAERARQDRGGFAAFPVPPGRTYRAVTAGRGGASAVVTAATKSHSWSPSFEDTFDGSALDAGVWNDQLQTEPTQGVRSCARIDPSVRSVGDGTLRLGIGLDPQRVGQTCAYDTPRFGPGYGPYLLNSQIDTRNRFDFTHGWAAARIKWQQARGMHGGFWLLPSNTKIPGRPDLGTEIDVVEHFGQGSLKGGIGAFVHHVDADGANIPLAADFPRTTRLKPRRDQWWSSYHVFSVEWTPQEYVFRIDGREFWREDRHVSQAGEYLVLSMLTSDYELKDLEPSEYAAAASVDWVRVWND